MQILWPDERRSTARRLAEIAALLLTVFSPAAAVESKSDVALRQVSVGVAARIDQIVLPGTELQARPIDSRQVPLVLRVVATYSHGSAFRYDLEFYGLEPGLYDLGDYLQRKDGSPVEGLPKLPVQIVSLLPKGQILPADLRAQPAPRLGGYRLWLILAAIAWLAGLVAILFARRRAQRSQQQAVVEQLSLAERLRPLVAAAVDGRLSPEGTAEIERLLLSYWRQRLNLDQEDPLAAVATLRGHEQAGTLLRQVEAWLHKPGGASEVDLRALLAPYGDLPAESPPKRQADMPCQPTVAGGPP